MSDVREQKSLSSYGCSWEAAKLEISLRMQEFVPKGCGYSTLLLAATKSLICLTIYCFAVLEKLLQELLRFFVIVAKAPLLLHDTFLCETQSSPFIFVD